MDIVNVPAIRTLMQGTHRERERERESETDANGRYDGIGRVIRNDLQVGVYINLCAVESNFVCEMGGRERQTE